MESEDDDFADAESEAYSKLNRKKKPRERSNHSINPREMRFVQEYLKDGVATQAAIRAGWSAKSAKSQGYEILHRPRVRAEIEKARTQALEIGVYNLKAAMLDTQAAIDFARETGNATALIKAVEHKAKLNGLLIERHDVRQSGFVIQISGIHDAPSQIVAPSEVIAIDAAPVNQVPNIVSGSEVGEPTQKGPA